MQVIIYDQRTAQEFLDSSSTAPLSDVWLSYGDEGHPMKYQAIPNGIAVAAPLGSLLVRWDRIIAKLAQRSQDRPIGYLAVHSSALYALQHFCQRAQDCPKAKVRVEHLIYSGYEGCGERMPGSLGLGVESKFVDSLWQNLDVLQSWTLRGCRHTFDDLMMQHLTTAEYLPPRIELVGGSDATCYAIGIWLVGVAWALRERVLRSKTRVQHVVFRTMTKLKHANMIQKVWNEILDMNYLPGTKVTMAPQPRRVNPSLPSSELARWMQGDDTIELDTSPLSPEAQIEDKNPAACGCEVAKEERLGGCWCESSVGQYTPGSDRAFKSLGGMPAGTDWYLNVPQSISRDRYSLTRDVDEGDSIAMANLIEGLEEAEDDVAYFIMEKLTLGELGHFGAEDDEPYTDEDQFLSDDSSSSIVDEMTESLSHL